MPKSFIESCADLIRSTLPRKTGYEQTLSGGILRLIEQSNYGQKDAEVEISLTHQGDDTGSRELAEIGFSSEHEVVSDRLEMLCESLFDLYGQVKITHQLKGPNVHVWTIVYKVNASTGGKVN